MSESDEERTHYYGDDCDPPHECPGGPADLLGPGIGRCRWCDYVFVTVMDEPTLPPHVTRGDVTTFGVDRG